MFVALAVVGWTLHASPIDPLEATRIGAEPIAALQRFDPDKLRLTAGPAFLTGAWQQQLFFQRSIDARNPYYGTGLPR